ncbi:hypothetical protein GCM10010517_44310 [Streptosporangium fragile]|uniref:Uncharacterized protein n=1 Tax=Streptosporangium fragile TaxID=46186 RepID=A0ABN3W116_9ACTN
MAAGAAGRAEGWGRLPRRAAFAGQIFADATGITHAVAVATAQLNAHARPRVRGRPPPRPRILRRKFVYLLCRTKHPVAG